MKSIPFLIFIITFQQCIAQSGALPECIEKLSSKENRIYEGMLELPNGETVYKIRIERPKNCMDCIGGTKYLDSNCETVARRTIGRAPNKPFVKEGYELEWFFGKKEENKTENKYPILIRKRDTINFFKKFDKPVKFKVKKIVSKKNPFNLKQNDILTISNQDGMVIHRQGKKQNQYKLMPENSEFSSQPKCVKAPCPKFKTSKSYFRWDDWGIFINQNNKLFLYNFKKHTDNNNSDWQENYEVEKLTEK